MAIESYPKIERLEMAPSTPAPYSRVFNKDLDAAIFRPKDDQEEVLEPSESALSEEIVVYTIVGKGDREDAGGYPILNSVQNAHRGVVLAQERDLACAMKKSPPNKQTRFYVRTESDGRFVDPTSATQEFRHNKVRLGLSELRWKEVNRKSFMTYLEFLRTKNRANLVTAEREAF